MVFTWKCQKCFRYLANIEVSAVADKVTQRTVCPRCKSENKVTLNHCSVVLSCGFSAKFLSNLQQAEQKDAPDTRTILVEKTGQEHCYSAKIILSNQKR